MLLLTGLSILPGIFYWKISDPALDNIIYKVDEDNNEDDFFQRADTWQSRWLRRMSLALVAWGFLVMGVCLALNIFFIPAE